MSISNKESPSDCEPNKPLTRSEIERQRKSETGSFEPINEREEIKNLQMNLKLEGETVPSKNTSDESANANSLGQPFMETSHSLEDEIDTSDFSDQLSLFADAKRSHESSLTSKSLAEMIVAGTPHMQAKVVDLPPGIEDAVNRVIARIPSMNISEPTPEGGWRFEWIFGPERPSLVIDSPSSMYFHSYNLSTKETQEVILKTDDMGIAAAVALIEALESVAQETVSVDDNEAEVKPEIEPGTKTENQTQEQSVTISMAEWEALKDEVETLREERDEWVVDRERVKTFRHIERVEHYLHRMIRHLIKRAENHDRSKLLEPEASLFAQYGDRLDALEYGSEEYKKNLVALERALEHHYANNRHHPQHFENGVRDMNLIDILEMFCDWKASSERQNGGNLRKSLEENAERFELPETLVAILKNSIDLLTE